VKRRRKLPNFGSFFDAKDYQMMEFLVFFKFLDNVTSWPLREELRERLENHKDHRREPVVC